MDFEIHPSLIEAAEEMNELQRRVGELAKNELAMRLVCGVHRDMDFVDVHITSGGEVEYIGWREGGEPSYDIYDTYSSRYDIRGVSVDEIINQWKQN